VQQAPDPDDSRTTQTFLTPKGKRFKHEIVRLIRSDRQRGMKLRSFASETSQRDLARDQWLSKLIAAGRKLDAKDVKLATQLIEALVSHRQL
jgi:hypothetical protein